MIDKEKAKAYDEAVKRAKKFYGNRIAKEIFPELKESEDEKIRKEIISILRNAYWTSNRNRFNECVLFPSKEQRDWSKFTAPWYKKERFDPKTLKPFDKVIARCSDFKWVCDMFSHYDKSKCVMPYVCVGGLYEVCIPYNDETKHLVGITEEEPEYYRYWEE